jgi:hypothetical protein
MVILGMASSSKAIMGWVQERIGDPPPPPLNWMLLEEIQLCLCLVVDALSSSSFLWVRIVGSCSMPLGNDVTALG